MAKGKVRDKRKEAAWRRTVGGQRESGLTVRAFCRRHRVRETEFLGQDPLSGHLFLFIGRARDRLKILYWDADGFAVWYKRLEEGTFRLPAADPDTASVELKASDLAMLLEGIDLRSLRRGRRLVLASQRT